MKLAGDKPGMARQFDHFHEIVNRQSGELQTCFRKLVTIIIVHFVAMSVALEDFAAAVNACHLGTVFQVDVLRTQAHRTAHIGIFAALFNVAFLRLPFRNQRNHRMWRLFIEFRAVGTCQSRKISCGLNDSNLHAKANAEIGSATFACKLYGLDLALNATITEAAGDNDPIHRTQAIDAIVLNLL